MVSDQEFEELVFTPHELSALDKIKMLFSANRIAGSLAQKMKMAMDTHDIKGICKNCEIGLAVIDQLPQEDHIELVDDIIAELKRAKKLMKGIEKCSS